MVGGWKQALLGRLLRRRLLCLARLETVRGHHLGRPAYRPSTGSPSGRLTASRSTTSAGARRRPCCTACCWRSTRPASSPPPKPAQEPSSCTGQSLRNALWLAKGRGHLVARGAACKGAAAVHQGRVRRPPRVRQAWRMVCRSWIAGNAATTRASRSDVGAMGSCPSGGARRSSQAAHLVYRVVAASAGTQMRHVAVDTRPSAAAHSSRAIKSFITSLAPP